MKEFINSLLTYAKAMKLKDTEYIYLDLEKNKIYSVNTCCIKSIDNLLDIINTEFEFQDFHRTIYNVKFIKDLCDKDCTFNPETFFIPGLGLIGNNIDVINIMNAENIRRNHEVNISYMLDNPYRNDMDCNVYEYYGLEILPEFIEVVNQSSALGAKTFAFDSGHMIKIFSGLLPVLKSDKVNAYINDYGDHFMVKFEIIKKKIVVNQYMLVLKI